jgi:hypothetical protein
MIRIPIRASCLFLRASRDSGERRPEQIKHVVIHSTEGGTAAGVASMFHSKNAKASTHLVVDDRECWRMLHDLVIPWGATGANTSGLHIEHCGYASWSREEWLLHTVELRRSAYRAARWCRAYRIPRRFIGKYRLKLGWKGFVTHKTVSDTFPGSGHWDPGNGFPKDVYMSFVKEYYRELEGR